MGIALVALALALICLWSARRGRESSVVRFKVYWAGMCFLVLGFGSAYMQILEWRSPEEVSQYLPVYPMATVRSRAPVAIDHARAWTFETTHSVKSVGDFYAKIARTNGWQMKRELANRMEVIVLRQTETVTTILASPNGRNTEITYMVRAAAPPSD